MFNHWSVSPPKIKVFSTIFRHSLCQLAKDSTTSAAINPFILSPTVSTGTTMRFEPRIGSLMADHINVLPLVYGLNLHDQVSLSLFDFCAIIFNRSSL